MGEYAVLNLSSEVMKKIDGNRGQLSRSEFLECIVRSWCLEQHNGQQYVTQEEFRELAESVKELLRSCMDFFVSYGLDLGKAPEGSLSGLLDQLRPYQSATHASNGHNGNGKTRGSGLPPQSHGGSNGLGEVAAD